MGKIGCLALLLVATGSLVGAQTRTTTFAPCAQALQRLKVPEQIHLIQACQVSPEAHLRLSFLLSENGVDVYRLEYRAMTGEQNDAGGTPLSSHPSPDRYPFTVQALLVYQTEQAREAELRVLTGSPTISWFGGYDDPQTGRQEDWGSIVSFKYETVEFVWLDKANVLLRHSGFYVPVGCMTPRPHPASSNFSCGSPDIESNEIGVYDNISPPPLSQGTFLYRVATLLAGQLAPVRPSR